MALNSILINIKITKWRFKFREPHRKEVAKALTLALQHEEAFLVII
jgi:hypothetical protein